MNADGPIIRCHQVIVPLRVFPGVREGLEQLVASLGVEVGEITFLVGHDCSLSELDRICRLLAVLAGRLRLRGVQVRVKVRANLERAVADEKARNPDARVWGGMQTPVAS